MTLNTIFWRIGGDSFKLLKIFIWGHQESGESQICKKHPSSHAWELEMMEGRLEPDS